MLENLDVFVAISEHQKSSVCMLAIWLLWTRCVRLSNLISDVVLIGMTYYAPVLLYEFILSIEFSTA